MSLFAAERCQVKVKSGSEAIAYCVQGLEHIQEGRVLVQWIVLKKAKPKATFPSEHTGIPS